MRAYLDKFDFEYFEKDIFNYTDIDYLDRLNALSLGIIDYDLSVKNLKYSTIRNERNINNISNINLVNDSIRLDYTVTNNNNFSITIKSNNEIIFSTNEKITNIYLNELTKNNIEILLTGATLNKAYDFYSKANYLVIFKTLENLFSSFQFKNQDIWQTKASLYRSNYYELYSFLVSESKIIKNKELIR